MNVECLLDRFERERVANTSNALMLSRIAGWVPDEQFLEVAGLDGPARCRVAYDWLKFGAESERRFTLRRRSVNPRQRRRQGRMHLTPGLLFDVSRSCWDTDVQANAERLCEYLRTERPDLQSMDRRDPKFSKTLDAEFNFEFTMKFL